MAMRLLAAAGLAVALGACAPETAGPTRNEDAATDANRSDDVEAAAPAASATTGDEPPPAPDEALPETNRGVVPPGSDEPPPATEDEYLRGNEVDPRPDRT